MPEKEKRLYEGEAGEETHREIVREYEEKGESPKRAEESYGAIVGKAAREQAAKAPGGVKREQVKGHISFSSRGTPYRVKAHTAFLHAERHGRGHHGGPCPPGCRQGMVPHRHRRGSRSRG